MKERFDAFSPVLPHGPIDAALGNPEGSDDVAGSAISRVDELRRGQAEHPKIVRGVRVNRIGAHEIRPTLLVTPYAENIIYGRCALRNKG